MGRRCCWIFFIRPVSQLRWIFGRADPALQQLAPAPSRSRPSSQLLYMATMNSFSLGSRVGFFKSERRTSKVPLRAVVQRAHHDTTQRHLVGNGQIFDHHVRITDDMPKTHPTRRKHSTHKESDARYHAFSRPSSGEVK